MFVDSHEKETKMQYCSGFGCFATTEDADEWVGGIDHRHVPRAQTWREEFGLSGMASLLRDIAYELVEGTPPQDLPPGDPNPLSLLIEASDLLHRFADGGGRRSSGDDSSPMAARGEEGEA